MQLKFSKSAIAALKTAKMQSLQTESNVITGEHLLLGLLANTSSYQLRRIFEEFRIEMKTLTKDLFDYLITLKNSEYRDSVNFRVQSSLTARAAKILEFASWLAEKRNSNQIGPLHIFLSYLSQGGSKFYTEIISKKYKLLYTRVSELVDEVGLDYIEADDISDGATQDILGFSDFEILDGSPLNLIFNTSEYTNEEIKQIITLLSELYSKIGGDYLKITGMNQFERKVQLDIA